MSDAFPYLSIVITSRNDDHGGDMLQRMRTSLCALLEQLEKYSIESELILIEWNPPEDKPLLKDIFPWPQGLNYCTIRVIEVEPAVHQQYIHWRTRPVHCSASQNIGIRRARGQFILPAAIDVLFSEELMSFIGLKKLHEDERYRVDRCDVKREVVNCRSLTEQLDYCNNNIIRINTSPPHNIKGLPELHTNACGDFQLMSKYYWRVLRGYREADWGSVHIDGILSFASYAAGVKEVYLKRPRCVYHIDHDDKFIDKAKIELPLWGRVAVFIDKFMPERLRKNTRSLYYKIKPKGMNSRITVGGIPIIDISEVFAMSKRMINGEQSYVLNDEKWGLGDRIFSEFIISVAQWESKRAKNHYESNT